MGAGSGSLGNWGGPCPGPGRCQEKLKTARQTITNLQGVNKEMEQLHSHSRALEEEKSRVTDAYTAIEEQMRSMQGMLAENEEIGVSK